MIVTAPLLFTQPQLQALLRRNGFKPRVARVGGAIALCESPWFDADVPTSNAHSIGDQDLANATWGYSYGLFQVRSLRSEKGTGGIRDEDRLLDPDFNAHSAKMIRKASGWQSWTTFTNGAYKAYLQDLFPPPPNTYVVVGGDSLSSIAASYGWFSWEDLARANNLHEPYVITIGQWLTLPTVELGVDRSGIVHLGPT